MKNYIDTAELKSKIDVVKFLQDFNFEKIQDEGEWVVARCVYHEDDKPSFSMKKGTTQFHCWSCKESGDAIKLVMDMNNVDFNTALCTLANMVGYSTDGNGQLDYLKNKWLKSDKDTTKKSKEIIPNERIFELNKIAEIYFRGCFINSLASDYLKNRGFTDESAFNYLLGYYPSECSFITEVLSKGFTIEELKEAGFLTEFRERFTSRLMFPICDLNNRVVAFSGRALAPDQEPKYTASPNSSYYKKGNFLYGLQNVKQNKPFVLVEGNLDCIRLQSVGINSLAQLGTALTNEQCDLIKSISNKIGLMYDGDEAGKKSFITNIPTLIRHGIVVHAIILPEGYDPDSYVLKFGVDKTKELIKDAMPTIEYYSKNSPIGGYFSFIALLASIKNIKEKEIQNYYIKSASETFKLSEESVRAELKRAE